jgi:hypothetical protein
VIGQFGDMTSISTSQVLETGDWCPVLNLFDLGPNVNYIDSLSANIQTRVYFFIEIEIVLARNEKRDLTTYPRYPIWIIVFYMSLKLGRYCCMCRTLSLCMSEKKSIKLI